ncbi:MAG: hypothetical protein GX594_03420, partial [Pirellulaceae bacterium]|nr:hypothetical protein [Pirellulaceae bacterium]
LWPCRLDCRATEQKLDGHLAAGRAEPVQIASDVLTRGIISMPVYLTVVCMLETGFREIAAMNIITLFYNK